MVHISIIASVGPITGYGDGPCSPVKTVLVGPIEKTVYMDTIQDMS